MENEFVKKGEQYLSECLFKGLAHSYDVEAEKFVKPYPEVTGYLVDYFSKYSEVIPERVIRAADTLIKLQDKKSGGYSSFSNRNHLYAFDTSQILIGLSSLYARIGDERYKETAKRGGEFLLFMQQGNGAIAPVYKRKEEEIYVNKDIYSIWNGPWSGLMCKLTEGFHALYKLTNDYRYQEALIRTADFYEKSAYIECTHPMGYWLEGLFAAGRTQIVRDILEERVIPRIRDNGYIPYREDLEYAYVSGVIQLGILLYKLGYVEEAEMIRLYGRTVQSRHPSGGLFQYANAKGDLDRHVHTEVNSWGTKYFCELERLMSDD